MGEADYDLDDLEVESLFRGQPVNNSQLLRCPYCRQPAQLLKDSKRIYNGVNYGPVWACLPCQAWVGCHKRGGFRPVGRLANAELREWKQLAHAVFDPEWRGTGVTRTQAYRALGTVLGMRQNDCHIGMFDVNDCERVILACQYGLITDELRGL